MDKINKKKLRENIKVKPAFFIYRHSRLWVLFFIDTPYNGKICLSKVIQIKRQDTNITQSKSVQNRKKKARTEVRAFYLFIYWGMV